jgi:hypothetical protein
MERDRRPTSTGNTIVVGGQLVRLHGIDAPELDQTFWWRGQRTVRCRWSPRGTHSRGSRCAARWSRGTVAKSYLPNVVDIGRRSYRGRWRTGCTRWTMSPPRSRSGKPSAGCGGAPSSNPGVARIVTAAPRDQCYRLRPGHDGLICAIVCTPSSGRDVEPAVPVGQVARTTSSPG